MKIITSKELKEFDIDCIVFNSPVLIGLETGKALEMGCVFGDTVQETVKNLCSIVDTSNSVIYLYEDFDLNKICFIKPDAKYVIRFSSEIKTNTPIIVKEIDSSKLNDIKAFFGEEICFQRIKRDLEILYNENKKNIFR